MKKYLYEFKMFFLDAFHYRFNVIINLFFGNVSTIITVLFWILIYRSNGKTDINGFSLSHMITYYIVCSVVRGMIFSNSGFIYVRMIKEGKLNSELLKPYNINLSLYFKNLAACIAGIFPQMMLVIALVPVLHEISVLTIELQNLLFVLIFMVVSTVSSHMVWSILGLLAFWMEEANAVMWSFSVLFNLISGMFLPLDFFPELFLSIIKWLPFSCWIYLPTKIYLGLIDFAEMGLLLAVNIGWIIALWILYKVVWSIGIKRYSSIGG